MNIVVGYNTMLGATACCVTACYKYIILFNGWFIYDYDATYFIMPLCNFSKFK